MVDSARDPGPRVPCSIPSSAQNLVFHNTLVGSQNQIKEALVYVVITPPHRFVIIL